MRINANYQDALFNMSAFDQTKRQYIKQGRRLIAHEIHDVHRWHTRICACIYLFGIIWYLGLLFSLYVLVSMYDAVNYSHCYDNSWLFC